MAAILLAGFVVVVEQLLNARGSPIAHFAGFSLFHDLPGSGAAIRLW